MSPQWVTGPEQGKSSGRIATFSLWTGMFRDGISSIPGKITPILDKLLEYKWSWIQHVNRLPRNRLSRVMKHYSPTGRRNHGRLLKRLLNTWDWNSMKDIWRWWWIYIKTLTTLLHVSIIWSSSGSILCSLLNLQIKTLSDLLSVVNCNFSKEQSMLPEDDHMIKTCWSVLSVLM